MAELSGHCLCGAVRFKVQGAVLGAGHCHCESCRRAASSPVTSFLTVERANAELAGESLRFYASSPGVRRGFCGQCGSPMSFESERRPAEIDFYVASLEGGQSVVLREHWHWDERVDWLDVVDDLPKSEKGASAT